MSDKKKVIYLTTDSFLDVDLPIIEGINKHTDLSWIVLFSDITRSDHQVFSPDYIKAFSDSRGIKTDILISKVRVRNLGRIYSDWKIIREMIGQNPDVIYFDGFPDYYFPIIARMILGKKKVIIAVHDAELHPGNVNIIHRVFHWITDKMFHNFHLFSLAQNTLFKIANKNKNTFIIGLYLKDFGKKSRQTEKSKTTEKTNFLFFGRSYPYKGLGVLLKATGLLNLHTHNFTVTIAGKCDNLNQISNGILDNAIYKIRNEFIQSKDIPGIFENADFLVLPYTQVTQSGPLMIALNYGVPVIASDLDGFKEYIIHGETGFLFPVNDTEKLASVMDQIINMDKMELQRIKNNLQSLIRSEFNIENHILKYLNMFNAV